MHFHLSLLQVLKKYIYTNRNNPKGNWIIKWILSKQAPGPSLLFSSKQQDQGNMIKALKIFIPFMQCATKKKNPFLNAQKAALGLQLKKGFFFYDVLYCLHCAPNVIRSRSHFSALVPAQLLFTIAGWPHHRSKFRIGKSFVQQSYIITFPLTTLKNSRQRT